MERWLKIIRNLLLAFVLVSIGYVFGKYAVRQPQEAALPTQDTGPKVHVYYLHGTRRCASCNQIERMTREALDKKFAKEMKNGQVTFSEANFQKDEVLADKFDILTSTVVVTKLENGKVVAFQRLDKVWTLKDDPAAFDELIENGVSQYLQPSPGGGK